MIKTGTQVFGRARTDRRFHFYWWDGFKILSDCCQHQPLPNAKDFPTA